MNLGITVDQVIQAKLGSYLDTLPSEERSKKFNEYREAAEDTLNMAIKEASTLADSIESTSSTILASVPNTISQVASLVGILDPVAKAAQLTTIIESVGNSKDQIMRANSQLESLSNLLIQLNVSSNIISILRIELDKASELLSTIPV